MLIQFSDDKMKTKIKIGFFWDDEDFETVDPPSHWEEEGVDAAALILVRQGVDLSTLVCKRPSDNYLNVIAFENEDFLRLHLGPGVCWLSAALVREERTRFEWDPRFLDQPKKVRHWRVELGSPSEVALHGDIIAAAYRSAQFSYSLTLRHRPKPITAQELYLPGGALVILNEEELRFNQALARYMAKKFPEREITMQVESDRAIRYWVGEHSLGWIKLRGTKRTMFLPSKPVPVDNADDAIPRISRWLRHLAEYEKE